MDPKNEQVTRPKIKLRTTATDWALEAVGFLGMILTWAFLISYYNDLPAKVPRHFNTLGRPDGFDAKSILVGVPVLASVIFLCMSLGLRFPHAFNYFVQITDENAERQYKNLTLMTRILKALLAGLFFYLTYATIQIGLGKMQGLGLWFVPMTAVSLVGTIGYFISKGFKLQ